jgi:hypothetical protein
VIEGSISGSAHLAGPVSRVGISGKLAVANLHGWNQSPPGGNAWPLAVGGVVDASGQTIDLIARLDTARLAIKDSPIELRYRASDYLKRPQWGVTATLNQFALAPLAGIARNLGWAIPPDFGIEGSAAGAVSYSGPSGNARMDGGLMLENCVLTVSGAPPLRAPGAHLRFSGSSVILAPSPITNDRNETATLEGSWDSAAATADGAFDATLSSDGMAIPSLSRQISVAGIPLLSQATAGTWKGRLHYSGAGPGWQGELHLADTILPFEAFAEPLHIVSADAAIDGAALNVRRISLAAGGIAAQGEYRYDPAAARPHRFRVAVPKADAAAIEKLLMPTLRRGNFFTYAFSFGRAPEPDWLRNMRADGNLQIGALSVGDEVFTQVQTHVVWDGSDVKLNDLKSRLGPATFAGILTAHLNGRQPAYEAEGKLRGFEWRSGAVDADASLVTSGTGTELLSRLRAKGTFEGRNLELPPLETYDSLSGAFELAWDARGPRLRIPQLTAKSAAGTLQGSAEPGDNGQVSVKLSDEARHIQSGGEFVLRTPPEK